MRVVTAVLADDHQMVREGLRAYLERDGSISVIGEASDGLETIDRVQSLHPDILILDLRMPNLGGLEVTRRLAKQCPKTRVIILSMYSSEAYVMQALRNGAAGYVLKESAGEELVMAIKTVSAGRRYLSPPLTEHAIDAFIQRTVSAPLDLYETLTNREREVLQLAAEGRNNSEIADRLGIAPRTAETHRTHIMRKLGLRNNSELVIFAVQRKILLVPE